MVLHVKVNYDKEIWSDSLRLSIKHAEALFQGIVSMTRTKWCPEAKDCVGTKKYERLIKALKD